MASDFDTLTTTARNSKWENNAPGKVLPMPQKVSSKSISGKMDIYPQKDSHAERNNGEQNKVKPSHKVLREKSIPNSNATMPDLSSSFVNAMFNGIKYNGLNIPQNFTDPSSAALNAAYLNAFGLPPFSPLPLQFNPGNIAVASVMPNALETLAAQLGSIGHPHMPPSPHSPCTSPSDFNPSNVFPNSLRSRIPSFINDYHDQQLSNYLRFYSNSLNPLIAGQDNATFPKPSSSRKHPMPKSDKSRKEQAVETSRAPGVSTLDKTNYAQNGDEISNHGRQTAVQTSSKPKVSTDVGQQSDNTRRSFPHKLPVLPNKDQRGRVPAPQNEGTRSADRLSKNNHIKPEATNRLAGRSKTVHTLKSKDFGDEEAAAILLHLSSATESECVKETSVQDKCKRVVSQQPIDYSARTTPHKESTNCKRWSNPNLSFQTISKGDNSHNPNKDKLNSNKQMVDSISPNSELVLSDNEYSYELNSDDSKNQPGGFNFKKVICKKFTAERDPNDSTEVADGDNSINEQNKLQPTSDLQHTDRNMTNFNPLQYDPVNNVNMAKTTTNQSHSFKEKCVKSHPKPIHGKIKLPTNHSHKSSNKKYIKPSRSDYNNSKTSDKPHINAQSFSDLRAISKHFQTNNASTKSTHRTGAKGLYRDAFGGSSDSMESVGESENEDKEDDESESESESSSEEESEEEEENEESDASEKDAFPRSSWNDENSPIKRQFSLSRPKFTLSKATFQSKDHQTPPPAQQPIVIKEHDNSNDQSRFTIRSPTFKFSKLSNESKLKATEPRDYSTHSNKSGGGFKHRVKIMPRVSAITLPKPRLAARASKNVDKSRKFATLPELKLEDGSKSSLKALFMQALNKSGETGGKPVGIPVDHKSLKAIGLGTTSYFLHNNKKYILRRALAKKKAVSVKQSGKESVKETFTLKNKSKYIIQQVPSTKHIRREATACKGDNEVNNAEQAKRNDANNDQSKKISKPSSAKRRKRSLDFIPTITCDDDCDIFSKVKLRHRTSLHNLAKDNSNASNSNVKQNNTISTHTVTHHSRKRQWHKHAKRSLKSSTDLFLLNQLTYSKSVARAKKICMRRNENLRKNAVVIRKNDFNKRPSHSVRIMAGATRPSYQILRQIRETKDENNNLLEARKANTEESHNLQVDKMEIETEKNYEVANSEIPPSIEIVAKAPPTPQQLGNNLEINRNEKNVDLVNAEKNCSKNTFISPVDDLISGVGDDVITTIKHESNYDGNKVNKLKRKAAVGSRPKLSNESFKLLSLFTSPPTMSLDPAFCDVQPSYNMWIPSNELHKPSVNKNSLLNWKFGENAVEIKQQQQRDEWKSMTVNTFPNA